MKYSHLSFGILRPFPSAFSRIFRIRVVIVRDSEVVLHRYNQNKGAKAAEPLRGYWCSAKYLVTQPDQPMTRHASRDVLRGEICIAATAFDPSTIVHESYHCVMDAKADRFLDRNGEGWEETIAYCLDHLTGIVWRRGEPYARTLLRG